ncbi:MAG: hypothetical protein ACOC1P_04590 [Minisyncoccales bacterium]
MYKINFSNTGYPQSKNCQKYDKMGNLASFLQSNWKTLDIQQNSVFGCPMTGYFHHPEKSCISIFVVDNPPYISFLSINKETLKETLEELVLDFDEEKITEF